jgi:NDP-sugar pyrophosphorylase family protein
MRAMILAAGYGTRLWPLTIDRAKPAIPFMGRPLVGYVAEYLARFGFREVVVNLHHRPESVRAALGDGSRFGVRLQYVEEPSILGTSGALDNARELLDGDTFVVINGKLATDIDLNEALETHRSAGALATLVLRRNVEREQYSIVRARDGMVEGFGGFPLSDNASGVVRAAADVEDAEVPLMFTGIQILDPRIFSFIPRGVFSHTVTDVYIPALKEGEVIAAHVARGYWHELSTVKRYLDTSLELMKSEGRDLELGEGSHVEPGADVRESVLWEGVRVSEGASVRGSVLGAGVVIGRGERIENSVVVHAELIDGVERPAKGLEGEVRGSNFVAPLPE